MCYNENCLNLAKLLIDSGADLNGDIEIAKLIKDKIEYLKKLDLEFINQLRKVILKFYKA